MANTIPPSRSKWRTEYGLLGAVIVGVTIGLIAGYWKIGFFVGLGVGLLLQLGAMNRS